jgi:hypothetical protein
MLILRVFIELLRYEVLYSLAGFRAIHASVRRARVALIPSDPAAVSVICDAVALAACFYWKPVLCLQRAVVTTRLLRRRGVPADMVIGYRPSPFFSHAWVEVDGTIVNDSPTFQQRLLVLDRL